MKLTDEIRQVAGDGIGEHEYVTLYYRLLRGWADRIEYLERRLDGRCPYCEVTLINNAKREARETGKCINCGEPWREGENNADH